MLDIAATYLTLTALLAYLNHRFVKLPATIGVMAIALLLSTILLGLNALGFSGLHEREVSLLHSIDFSSLLMQGMLSILLFAGALHVKLGALRDYRWQIGLLAVLGTAVSTLLVGGALWYLLRWCGFTLPLTYCMVFGALISPTDPIAVMGILKSARAPASLEIVIAGESLFNDGVGVVLFALIVGVITQGQVPSPQEGVLLLLREGVGGLLYGAALGLVTYFLLKSIDSYQEEVLITLAAVIGGYALASHLHVSGPLAMVVAGLIVGNVGRAQAMSDQTRQHVDMFWELLDSMFNALLFVLIGLQIAVITLSPVLGLVCLGVVLITVLARYLSVGLPIALLGTAAGLPAGSWQVLTWGGLRGGISVALALSLPAGAERDMVVTLTYAVVVFSILAQGMSIGALVRKVVPRNV
jgi:CPA1 family monovalent cation:H+ antiporter